MFQFAIAFVIYISIQYWQVNNLWLVLTRFWLNRSYYNGKNCKFAYIPVHQSYTKGPHPYSSDNITTQNVNLTLCALCACLLKWTVREIFANLFLVLKTDEPNQPTYYIKNPVVWLKTVDLGVMCQHGRNLRITLWDMGNGKKPNWIYGWWWLD